MKAKLPLLFIVCTVAVLGCAKSTNKPDVQNEPNSGDKQVLHRVSLNLGKFEVDYARKANAKEMSAAEYLQYLSYSIFDSTGKRVHGIEQRSFAPPYLPVTGVISDSLPSGMYTVVLAGMKIDNDSSMFIKSPENIMTMQIQNRRALWYGGSNIFYKKFALRVSNSDTSLSSIKLDKITGKLELNLLDSALPANVYGVSLEFRNTPAFFNVGNELVSNVDTLNRYYFWPAPGHVFPDMSSFHIGSENRLVVTIRAYDRQGALLKEKVVGGVIIYKNKRTILSGKLFPGPADVEIPVTVDPDFPETTYQTF
ncbi:hypothetical protein QTN47_03885 [Danxiaibacter flavus]|uniref:FimB/Mfa2 family fimbrial subunit n=1 Tax=Danxiaibacter flavus TaxID=3049108 RepID=A0ABV3Z9S4_9BACT|nr:hypothetical protein QNM32_03885 [Chitinophagaceae bacterium DXS]